MNTREEIALLLDSMQEEYPHLRVGQIIYCAIGLYDIFVIEDWHLLALLKRWGLDNPSIQKQNA